MRPLIQIDNKKHRIPSSVIVVPIYKEIPSNDDLISLRQCFKIFNNRSIIIIKPYGLSLQNYHLPFASIEEFDTRYFSDIAGYNALMLSSEFYKRFLSYKYVLIYQTDAFVFKDNLDFWCNKDYDFIGAPWLYPYVDFVKDTKENIRSWVHRRFNVKERDSNNIPTERQFRNRVGNGGFSLRKVEVFFRMCNDEKELIKRYLQRTEKQFNEDVFWSIEVNRRNDKLKIPTYKRAISFSLESCPEYGFMLLGSKLPFGCHAWDKNRGFWEPIFKKYGYDI